MADETRIKEGTYVVLDSSDGKKVFAIVNKTSSARLGKRKRKLAPLLGYRFGDQFAIRGDDGLIAVTDHDNQDDIPDESDMATAKNNQFLQDTTTNQALEHNGINKLKESGVKGEDLVQTVAQHSSTFKDKTAFSQDKYLAKKRKKFDLRVRVVRPTAASLCDAYFHKSPDKTLHMRCDALALVLAYSNVRSGARCLVYENCTGLLTGAVAERLGGVGRIINFFTGCNPPGAEVVRMLNLPPDHARVISHTPVELLDAIDTEESHDSEPLRYVPKEDRPPEESNEMGNGDTDMNTENSTELTNFDDTKQTEFQPSARRAEAIALRPKRGMVKQWLRAGCDCLIVATRYDVVTVFDMLLKYVAPSGCFAAYCTHLQDAADLRYALQLSKMAIRIELYESTMVNHQVLPGRTHPAMTDSATGGYVVTGIRIETAPFD